MRKEEVKQFEEMSLKVFGKKYEYQKLLNKGLVHDKKLVNPKGPSRPAFIAKRTKLTPAGCMAYMEQTLAMRERIKNDLAEKGKKSEQGRD